MSEFMYGVTADTKVGGDFSQPMPAGIHENVELVDVCYEGANADGTSDLKVIKFKFEDENGQVFNHLEFPINMETVKKFRSFNGETPDELAQNMAREQGARVKHICSCFLEDSVMENLNASSFKDFAIKLIEALGEEYVGVKLKIKLILDGKDYCKFPARTVSPFIARMDSSVQLQISTRRNRNTGELYERVVPRSNNSAPPSDGFGYSEELEHSVSDALGLNEGTSETDDLSF